MGRITDRFSRIVTRLVDHQAVQKEDGTFDAKASAKANFKKAGRRVLYAAVDVVGALALGLIHKEVATIIGIGLLCSAAIKALGAGANAIEGTAWRARAGIDALHHHRDPTERPAT